MGIKINLNFFGAPYGFEYFALDGKKDISLNNFLQMFDNGDRGKKMSVHRIQNSMHYVFAVYADKNHQFFTGGGRAGSLFGIDFVVKDYEITNTNQLYQVFLETFNNYVKNHIIEENSSGNLAYKTTKFNMDMFKPVANGFVQTLNKYPELSKTAKPLTSQTRPDSQRY